MEILVYILLALSAAALICSVLLTVNMFKCFTGSVEQDPERTKEDLKKYRNRMILSYAAAVVLITAAAVVKMIM